ncbi:hypothetical protein NL676_020205 [Syzygium grande]|nr:hypothetical protein NL676_020205 [Syzygium grande]
MMTAFFDVLRSVCVATMHTQSASVSDQIRCPSARHHARHERCPRFAVDDEFLVTSLPNSAARSWLHGAGASGHGSLCFESLRGVTYLLDPLTRGTVSLSSIEPSRKWRCRHRIRIGSIA